MHISHSNTRNSTDKLTTRSMSSWEPPTPVLRQRRRVQRPRRRHRAASNCTSASQTMRPDDATHPHSEAGVDRATSAYKLLTCDMKPDIPATAQPPARRPIAAVTFPVVYTTRAAPVNTHQLLRAKDARSLCLPYLQYECAHACPRRGRIGRGSVNVHATHEARKDVRGIPVVYVSNEKTTVLHTSAALPRCTDARSSSRKHGHGGCEQNGQIRSVREEHDDA